jgi:hypothetical protein
MSSLVDKRLMATINRRVPLSQPYQTEDYCLTKMITPLFIKLESIRRIRVRQILLIQQRIS